MIVSPIAIPAGKMKVLLLLFLMDSLLFCNVAEEHVAEERVERDELPQLIPTVYWLSNPQVARAVTQSFRQHYRQAYLSWSETPEHVKNRWFRAFMKNMRDVSNKRPILAVRFLSSAVEMSASVNVNLSKTGKTSKLSEAPLKEKQMESLTRSSSGRSSGNNFLLFMELRKKISTFRDIFDIPPLNGFVPIHELMISTAEDLHRMYPEFVSYVPTEKLKERNTHQRVEHLESQTRGGCHDFTPFSRDPRDPHNGATGSSASFTAAM